MKAFVFVCLLMMGLMGVAMPRRHHGAQSDRLPVTLYYEALCPYCKKFVTMQLAPSMLRIDRLPFTDLKLVPYGNARHDDNGDVYCQHGVRECQLNAWHGCILEHHEIAESLKLIACMMRGKKNRLNQCADRYKINVDDVKNCKKTRSVNNILETYAEETAKVSFEGVPAITLDNVYDADVSANLTDQFDDIFCEKYKQKFKKELENC
ncbi:hypothetical protein KR032_007850 [Drosophila birchii]|nr:hypothetical protein KR032_007850 [Drosophila birchii]